MGKRKQELLKISIPPIKCQGIKSKLVKWIIDTISWDKHGIWIEPFCGSGVVGFNVRPTEAIFSDCNPHIINFYESINTKKIDAKLVRTFLENEGNILQKRGKEYYYDVRSRFNESFNPLDFLFLNRSCFNGVIRFNGKGKFNVPFNNNPNRFSKAYITKIVNQVKYVQDLFSNSTYKFYNWDFRKTIDIVKNNDFIYSDPPYMGRHVDYFNSWNDKDELDLFELLKSSKCKFILSTWHHNKYRINPYIESHWSLYDFNIYTKEHFYHVGAKEKNRNSMIEALVTNYASNIITDSNSSINISQLELTL